MRGERRQRAEERHVVLEGLAEAEARVEHDALARDTRLLERRARARAGRRPTSATTSS